MTDPALESIHLSNCVVCISWIIEVDECCREAEMSQHPGRLCSQDGCKPVRQALFYTMYCWKKKLNAMSMPVQSLLKLVTGMKLTRSFGGGDEKCRWALLTTLKLLAGGEVQIDDGLARLVLQRRWSADRRGVERRKDVDDCHRQVSAPPPNIKSSLLNIERKKEVTYQILEAFSARRTQAQSATDLPPKVTGRG